MPQEIIDLLGRKFRVIPNTWEMVFNLKKEKAIPRDWVPCYTRDRLSNQSMGLFHSPDRKDYIMLRYVPHLDAYIIFKLKYLGYSEQDDMRFEYKYGKKSKHK